MKIEKLKWVVFKFVLFLTLNVCVYSNVFSSIGFRSGGYIASATPSIGIGTKIVFPVNVAYFAQANLGTAYFGSAEFSTISYKYPLACFAFMAPGQQWGTSGNFGAGYTFTVDSIEAEPGTFWGNFSNVIYLEGHSEIIQNGLSKPIPGGGQNEITRIGCGRSDYSPQFAGPPITLQNMQAIFLRNGLTLE